MTETLPSQGPSGSDLRARRTELQMTLAQVAGALLLSQRHVEALEADEPTAFYNHTFYQQARRRYAVLIGLSAPPDEPAPPPIEVDFERPPPAVTARPSAVSTTRRHRPVRRLQAVLVALFAVALAGLLVWQGNGPPGMLVSDIEPSPQPATATPPDVPDAVPEQPAAVPDAAGATPVAEPAARSTIDNTPAGPLDTNAAEPAVDAVYLFEAQRLCWVFARQINGKETKVTLKAGQRLALPGLLRYLAVGDLAAVRIWVDGSERDLQGFSADGKVARLGPAELRELRSGAGLEQPDID